MLTILFLLIDGLLFMALGAILGFAAGIERERSLVRTNSDRPTTKQ